MSALHPPPKIAVVIATCNRLRLLAERSLSSVTVQKRCPDILVVVDDSTPSVRLANAELVGGLPLRDCRIVYLENDRTAGASGAWNTALEFLVGEVDEPSHLFVAILDDDDSWSPEYLERCAATVRDHGLDMVATGLRRFESTVGQPLVSEAPAKLDADDFLTSNPGIQASNLFVRLSVLLAAGGFDESLRSTTDRDLCIRIAEMGKVRYGRLSGALVDHFADADRSRLSTRGSAAKLEGLTAFWRKHVGRMTAGQRGAFLHRAATLFGWRPPNDRVPEMAGYSDFRAQLGEVSNEPSPRRTAEDGFGKAPPHPKLRLYVGVITSQPSMLQPLLDGLVLLGSSDRLRGLAVLVLDNGSTQQELDAVVQGARRAGLDVAVIDEARQRLDAAAGGFGAALRDRPRGQVGIAKARTMLQRYLGAVLAADAGSFGWVLDDDMRVDTRARAYLPWLPAFREQGADVLIGAYEGSSPNPPLNGLRVQLVDLLHNLHWLRGLPGNMALPDLTAENAALRARHPDYYYDLSRKHTAHLELPHWLEPAAPGETVREAYSRLLNGAVGLLNGYPLTRPIIAPPPSNPLASAKDSVNRGGCTFILNYRALSETPNTINAVRGREARRSDMIWAIVNRHYRHMTIKAVAFPVQHVGRVNVSPSLDIEKVQEEIVGSTLYAGLTQFLRTRPHHELAFSCEALDEVCNLADFHLARRWRMLEQSWYRIAGLREAIRSLASSGELRDLVCYLDEWFTPGNLDRIRSGVGTHDRGDVREFLGSLRAVADDYARATVDIDFIHAQLWAHRATLTGGPQG